MSKIKHVGFMSSIKHNDLKPWYKTSEENEVISFNDENYIYSINSLLIEANTKDLYVRMLPSEYCLFIPSGEGRTFDLQSVNKIQVMGIAGQEIRWSGQFFTGTKQ